MYNNHDTIALMIFIGILAMCIVIGITIGEFNIY